MRIMMTSRVRERLRDERGIALPMVLLIFIVGVALIGAFLVAIVGSANVSTITRTSIQSQAAADAGIAAAQVILPARAAAGEDFCARLQDGSLESSLSSQIPRYAVSGSCDLSSTPQTVTIVSVGHDPASDSTSTVQATFEITRDNGGGDEPAGRDSIVDFGGSGDTVIHNGIALRLLNGDPPTNVTVRQQNYTCSIIVPGDIIASGNVSTNPCVVNGNVHIGGNFVTNNSGSNTITGTLTAAGSGAHVLSGTMGSTVRVNGSANLHNSAVVKGDLIVSGSGTTVISGVVEGNVISGGPVILNQGATVKGNLVSSSSAVASGGDNRATLEIKGVVEGDAKTNGNVFMPDNGDSGGWVKGSVFAAGTAETTASNRVGGNVTARGAVTVGRWHLAFPGRIMSGGAVSLVGNNSVGAALSGCTVGSVTNSITWNQPPSGMDAKKCQIQASALQFETLTAPAPVTGPVISGWQAYEYDASKWVGFAKPSVTCSQWNAWSGSGGSPLESLAENTVFDLRTCSNTGLNRTFEIGHDVVFLVNSINLNQLRINAKPNTSPKVWFIQPGAADGSGNPVCPSPGSTAVNFENSRLTGVITTVYTPCTVNVSNTEFTGSIYAGRITTGGASTLTFASVGIPGWSGNSGGGGAGGGGGSGLPSFIDPSQPISQRNID